MCRRRNIRPTAQRIEIFAELASSKAHPCAEDVYEAVRKRIPSVSLDTVYRNLRLMEAEGMITRVAHVEDRARFDANRQLHPHFICTSCGCVRDIDPFGLEIPVKPGDELGGDTVMSIQVELRGVCRSCRQAKK